MFEISYIKKIAGRSLVLMATTAMLSACADSTLLNRLTGEPPPGPLANRAGILRVDSREAIWPNLAQVPTRPTGVPPLNARQQEQAALEAQRLHGLEYLQLRDPPMMPNTEAKAPQP